MKIMIVLAILALFLLSSCSPKPILGSDCGTVSPDGRDDCCARKNVDAIHIMCVGSWKYTPEKGCEFVCNKN